jgi:hypothetical protein
MPMMKRTLLAVGVAILASMMWIPAFIPRMGHCRAWIFSIDRETTIYWSLMILQTVLVAVVAAVIVNLFRRKPK